MSKHAFDAFRGKLADDETLRSELTRVLGAGGKKTTASVEEVVAFAKTRGYEFSADEVRESSELSDQELGSVAGGATADHFEVSRKHQEFHIESLSFNYSKVQL